MVVAATTGAYTREGNEVEATAGATGAVTRQDNPLFQAAGAEGTARATTTEVEAPRLAAAIAEATKAPRLAAKAPGLAAVVAALGSRDGSRCNKGGN